MGQKSKKGCIGAVVGCSALAVIVVAVVGFFLYRQAKTFQENLTNPEPKTLQMLGITAMPEGYHANFAMKIPFLMEMIVMSTEPGTYEDKENQSGEPFGKKGFFYITFLRLKKDSTDLQDFFEGKTDRTDVLKDNGVNIDVDEMLQRGTFQLNDSNFFYMVQRGSFQAGQGRADGLSTMMLIQCPDDKKMRMAVWYGPDEANTEGVDPSEMQATLEGTVGDLDEVKSFVGQFNFCAPVE